MKKLVVLFVIAIVALLVYRKYSDLILVTKPDTTPDYVNHPARPKDIPYTTCSGDTIDWDWKKQRAYNEKRLFIEKDSTGCVLMVIIKIK